MTETMVSVVSEDGEVSLSRSEMISLLLRDSRVHDAAAWYASFMDCPTTQSSEVDDHEESLSADRISSLGPLVYLIHSAAHLLMLPILSELSAVTYEYLGNHVDEEHAVNLSVGLAVEQRDVLHDFLLGAMVSNTTLMDRLGLFNDSVDGGIALDERLVIDIDNWMER